MTALNKLKEVVRLFEQNGIEDAPKEAEILIAEVLDIDSSRLYSGDLEIQGSAIQQIDTFAARRVQGEPLQYIIGHVEFYGLKIHVGPGVLIPRPETELLVEETIKAMKNREELCVMGDELKDKDSLSLNSSLFTHHPSLSFHILDLCTGSGCIALALAKHFPEASVIGVDRSEAAMVYATQNAIENKVQNAHFRLGDLYGPVKGMTFDCIVSNPPYVRRDEIPTLQREVKDYEPVEALDGGADGLDFYRRILKEAPVYLEGGGLIILEIGYDQADDIKEIAAGAGLGDIVFLKDYAGIRRIMVGRSDNIRVARLPVS